MAYVVRIPQNAAAPVSDPPKYTTFGGSDTRPMTFLKSPSNIEIYNQPDDTF